MADDATILTPYGKTRLGELVAHLTLTASHRAGGAATAYPVEVGDDGLVAASDHVTLENRKISIQIYANEKAREAELAEHGRARRIFEEAMALRDARVPIVVVTGLSVYDPAVVINVGATRDGTTGWGFPIAIEVEELRTTRSRFTTIQVSEPVRHGAKAARAPKRKATKKAPEEVEKESSVLFDLFYGGG